MALIANDALGSLLSDSPTTPLLTAPIPLSTSTIACRDN
jgi:hypothetical protein